MIITKPKLVIFDMDGLIFNSEELFMNQKTLVMREYGYMEHRKEDYVKTLGLAKDALLAKLAEIYGPDYPADEISQKTLARVMEYVEAHGQEIKPGIPKLLERLKQAQIPCCVASSSPAAVVEKYLERSELAHYFDFILGGDQVAYSKPNPEIFIKACAKANVQPHDALVLEDSENGILAASRGGIPVICIPDLKRPCYEIAEHTIGIVARADEIEIEP